MKRLESVVRTSGVLPARRRCTSICRPTARLTTDLPFPRIVWRWLEQNPPAKQIDPGKVNGDFYENAMLGFSYRIPQGWVLKSANGIVQPAIERDRAKEDFGRPRMGRSERILMDACSKTLFSAWAKASRCRRTDLLRRLRRGYGFSDRAVVLPDHEVSQAKAAMSQAFKDFVAQFALTHPIVGDMGNGKVFSEDGIVFIYLHGTVAFQIPDDELSRRLSLAMAITERRGYLLTWFFAAPHDAELQGLTNERAMFDKTVNVASAGKPTPSETQPRAASDRGELQRRTALYSRPLPPSPASSARSFEHAQLPILRQHHPELLRRLRIRPISSRAPPTARVPTNPSLLRPGRNRHRASKARGASSSRSRLRQQALFACAARGSSSAPFCTLPCAAHIFPSTRLLCSEAIPW